MTRYYALQMVSLYLLMATGSLLQVSHAHTHTHTRTHARTHAHTTTLLLLVATRSLLQVDHQSR